MAGTTAIRTDGAPKALGPYSPGKAPEDIAGCGWKDVVKVTLWLTKSGYYDVVNGIYARFVAEPLPARSAPIVAAMPRGFLMAVEAIAKRA